MIADRDIKPDNVSCRLGAWLDLPPSLALREPYLSRLRALPLSELAVMVDGSRPGLADLRWTERDLERLRAAVDHHLIVTAWCAADREQIDALAARMPSLLRAAGTSWCEVDLEGAGGWKRASMRGFSSLTQAGGYLVEALRRDATTVEVSTFPGMLPAVAGALRAGADRLTLQVYATKTSGHTIAQCADWLRQAQATHPHHEVVAGVAAYGAPGSTLAAQTAHVRAALESAGSVVSTCRLWSAKHLVRTTARRYSVAALG